MCGAGVVHVCVVLGWYMYVGCWGGTCVCGAGVVHVCVVLGWYMN